MNFSYNEMEGIFLGSFSIAEVWEWHVIEKFKNFKWKWEWKWKFSQMPMAMQQKFGLPVSFYFSELNII